MIQISDNFPTSTFKTTLLVYWNHRKTIIGQQDKHTFNSTFFNKKHYRRFRKEPLCSSTVRYIKSHVELLLALEKDLSDSHISGAKSKNLPTLTRYHFMTNLLPQS